MNPNPPPPPPPPSGPNPPIFPYLHHPNNAFLAPFPRPTPQQPPPTKLPPPSTTTTTTTAITAPPPDLTTALSTLTDLLSLSHQTLTFSHLRLPPKPQDPNFIPCPYNPHHLMATDFLFLHSLHCPSRPILPDPSSLIDSLRYPTTLNLQNQPQNPVVKPESLNNDLSFSLEEYFSEFNPFFFYKDYPAVVNSYDLDVSKRTFTLPDVLYMECEDFVGSGGKDKDRVGFDRNGFQILPSDLWALTREVENWVDYPSVYSYGVLCVILRLSVASTDVLSGLIIVNSPRYGVVIDVYMRDHISVLFRICLKAIRKEALGLLGCERIVQTSSIKCPVLVQVLNWIVSQLSVLYGGLNAKRFAIDVLKQCVLEAANRVVLFPLESYSQESSRDLDANAGGTRDVQLERPFGASTEHKADKGINQSIDGGIIFASQLVAAVAALHERSLLEAKINGLWDSQLPPRFQRMAEHAYVSTRADEERKKRPNYRAIIEHDGILRKPSSNQESGKTKTRDELLAEERDYKRRRMSYRGKKLKRTTLEVMRDIIDEYMEEIKEAGGIGCFENETEDEGMSGKPTSAPDICVQVDDHRKSNNFPSEAVSASPDHYQKTSLLNHDAGSASFNDDSQDYEQRGRGQSHHRPQEVLEYQNRSNSRERHGSDHLEYQKRSDSRERHGREHLEYQKRSYSEERHGRERHSQSPERHKSHQSSYKPSSHRNKQVDLELTRTKLHKSNSSGKSRYHDHSASYHETDAGNKGKRKDDKKLDSWDRQQRKLHGNHNGKENAYVDRYDPRDRYDPTDRFDPMDRYDPTDRFDATESYDEHYHDN